MAGAKYPVEGLEAAEALLGPNVLGPEAVCKVLSVSLVDVLTADERQHVDRLPFDEATLKRAAAHGAMLVLRVPRDREGPLSIRRLHERFPAAFEPKSMTEGVGYSLRSEWTSAGQPFAADPPEVGWRLVSADPLGETCGGTYAQQDRALGLWAERTGVLGARVGRRSAVEAVYDLILMFQARSRRLLGDTWDWTRTSTLDGAFVTVGNFRDSGLQILAYSTPVKFGSLGACPEAR